jgi:vanillate O-demethylase ferredoxin subunit
MAPFPPERLQLQVRQRQPLAEDIVAFELQAPQGQPLPPFEAGAHIDLHLPGDTPGAPARVRSYSLCNAPTERHRYLIAVQCEHHGRGGSRWLHQHLQVGDVLPVGAPRNCFALRPAAHTLLLAGGIGLTPLLAMAETLWAADRSFALHIGVRSAARLPFAQRLAEAPWGALVQRHLDEDGPWQLPPLLAGQPPGTLACACGPAGFMAAVQRAAHQVGWADGQVVVEHFSAPPAAPGAAEPGHFQLLWAPTGLRLAVAPQHSVAQVLQAAGIALPLSCEQGICGQCCVQVLDGTPAHRDLVYGEHEHAVERRFTPCCSRASSPELVLAPLGWADAR